MSTDLFERYAQLDPARESEALPDWASAAPVLLATIDERTGSMQTQQTKPVTPPAAKKRRGWLAGVATFAAILIAAAVTVGVLQNSDDDTGIPVAGIENDPAAAEAFQAVEAAYTAYNTGDGEVWVEARDQGRIYATVSAAEIERESELGTYAAARGVEDRIAVTQCTSDGFGDWTGLWPDLPDQPLVSVAPVSTGYRFTCDAVHRNLFHDLSGTGLSITYQWVVADGEIIAATPYELPWWGDDSWDVFSKDFVTWLLRNHEDVGWEFLLQGLTPYPQPESASTALEYGPLFVEDSQDWPLPNGS